MKWTCRFLWNQKWLCAPLKKGVGLLYNRSGANVTMGYFENFTKKVLYIMKSLVPKEDNLCH